jgi:hypothetical protein
MNKKFIERTSSLCLQAEATQENFINQYDINRYSDYYYNQITNVFTFSNKDERIFFNFQTVGSYSTKSNTWMWAWGNKHIPEHNSKAIEIVREYGEEEKLKELTEAIQEIDQHECAHYVNLCATLTEATGVYKVSSEQLTSYFIFTGIINEEEVDKRNGIYIECDRHGGGIVSFVCKHIISEPSGEFHEAYAINIEDVNEKDELQAWCELCEKERLKEGEWNDESMKNVELRLLCHKCYYEAKKKWHAV